MHTYLTVHNQTTAWPYIVCDSRPSSAVRPVRLWPYHFFARNGFSRTTFLAEYVFLQGHFLTFPSRPLLMTDFEMIKD